MKEFVCIVCPRGCHVKVDEQGQVSGNQCIRGKHYVQNEMTSPTRIVTSTVKLRSMLVPRLPVITTQEVPKDKIFDVMNEINQVEVVPPIKVKDVLIKNVCDLGVDIVATRTVLE